MMHPVLSTAIAGFSDSLKYGIGSAGSWYIANVLPEESLFKVASGVTGWVLAMVTIYVLVKTVKTLFVKLEDKDAKLEAKDALIRSIIEKQRDDLQKEVDKHDHQ